MNFHGRRPAADPTGAPGLSADGTSHDPADDRAADAGLPGADWGFGGADDATGEAEPAAQNPTGGGPSLTTRFDEVLADFTVDSERLRARVLIATTAAQQDLAAGLRVPDPARRHQRTRPASTRPGGARPAGAPARAAHRRVVTRPRLVTAGALAAVASVIGVSAAIAGAVAGGSRPSVTITPQAFGTTNPYTVPPAVPGLTATATSTPSPPVASPSVAGRVTGTASPGQGGGGAAPGPGGVSALRGWDVTPFSSQGELVLPSTGTADWMVFGDGAIGVAARAQVGFPLVDAGWRAGIGTPERDYQTGVSWSWGIPFFAYSHYSTRLRIPGGQTATLTSFRGTSSGQLFLYVGGAASVRVSVSASGLRSAAFVARLPSSTAVLTIDLGNLPYWTPATISVTGGGGASFSLMAAVLR